MDQPGEVANPARGQLNRENNIPLSPCVPENLVSRDGFSRPVPRQLAHLHIYICVPIRYLGTLFSIINKVQISIRNKVPAVYKVPELTSALIGILKLSCIQVHLVFCLCFGVPAWRSM